MDIRIHKIRDKLELANLKNPKSRTFEDSYPKIASWHRSKVGNNGWLLGLLGSPRIAIIPFKGLGFLKVIEVPQIIYFIFGCSMIFNHVQWFLKNPAIGVPRMTWDTSIWAVRTSYHPLRIGIINNQAPTPDWDSRPQMPWTVFAMQTTGLTILATCRMGPQFVS